MEADIFVSISLKYLKSREINRDFYDLIRAIFRFREMEADIFAFISLKHLKSQEINRDFYDLIRAIFFDSGR
jgi:hypothetical protein